MKCPYMRQSKRLVLEPDNADIVVDFMHEDFCDCKGSECMAYEPGEPPICRLIREHKANMSDLK